MNDRDLNILVIDGNPDRGTVILEGLSDAGYLRVTRTSDMFNLVRRIYAQDPDVILIDLENPNRDTIEQMFQVSRIVRRPIAMFVDQSDTATIQAAVDAGVSAYVVDGLKRERVRPILDLTVSRFNAFAKLERELEVAKEALVERKVIERAKGILMRQRGVSEDEAYNLLRRAAMNEKRKLLEIAQSVVTAANLLDDG
ncbi:MAG: ANTAR domain-containing protein [Hyphomicrobiales bacterium]|nr:ANTAR domain-containing protein [Hyphomicrobiales bacterium]